MNIDITKPIERVHEKPNSTEERIRYIGFFVAVVLVCWFLYVFFTTSGTSKAMIEKPTGGISITPILDTFSNKAYFIPETR